MTGNFGSFLPSGNFQCEAIMHQISVGKHAVQLSNFQFCTLFFFFLSGMGFAAAAFLVLIDIVRWSIQ